MKHCLPGVIRGELHGILLSLTLSHLRKALLILNLKQMNKGPSHRLVMCEAFTGSVKYLDKCNGALTCINIMVYLNAAHCFSYHRLMKVSSRNWQ